MRVQIAMLLALVWLHACGCSRQRFPEWTARPLGLLGAWDQASLIVVADLQNVRALGSQTITKPPWPSLPNVLHVHWCEGDLHIYAVVKGSVGPDRRTFLWGQTTTDCDLSTYHGSGVDEQTGAMTRVWFLRQEGKYSRPVVDAGAPLCFTFNVKWDIKSPEKPSQQFARLLLTPDAVASTPVEYAQRFFHFASPACFIMGRDECVHQIKALADRGVPSLRREACEFLASQFHEECSAAPTSPR